MKYILRYFERIYKGMEWVDDELLGQFKSETVPYVPQIDSSFFISDNRFTVADIETGINGDTVFIDVILEANND